MVEKKIFNEIPGGKNNFHSAVLISFSFNFHHFEYQVLKSLKQKWINNIVVLADQNMLDQVIGFGSGNLKHLSQAYSLNGVRRKGAFHPKINYFLGDDKILMTFGSGNITPGGHGKNHELFTSFYADSPDSKQLPLLTEAWNYIRQLGKDLEGYPKDRIEKVNPANCSLLKNDPIPKHTYYNLSEEIDVALVYNEETTIFNQLTRLIPQEEIEKITVVCPYYDEDGALLHALIRHYRNSSLTVYLPKDFGLPPVKLVTKDNIQFFAWEETKRGKQELKGKNAYQRKLHSKIFHFQSQDYEYCLIGSANATIPGMGSNTRKAVNEEFGALYKTSEKGFLNQLGISGKRTKVDITHFKRDSRIVDPKEGKQSLSQKYYITNADLNGTTLRIYLKANKNLPGVQIVLLGSDGEEIHRQVDVQESDQKLNFKIGRLVLEQNPVFVFIINEANELISNKQVINHLDKLFYTDPSKSSRTIKQIISALEMGEINEFKLLTYINDIQSGKARTESNISKPFGTSDRNNISKTIPDKTTYGEAVKAAENYEDYDKVLRSHTASRLWETLSYLFKDKSETQDDALMDEEEEASAEVSRDRNDINAKIPSHKVEDKNAANRILNSIKKLVNNYIKGLKSNYHKSEYSYGVIEFSQFLLVTHILTAICYFPKYDLNEKLKEFNWKQLLMEYFIKLMRDTMLEFSKLLILQSKRSNPDSEYESQKLEKYANDAIYNSILFIYLIQRQTSEKVILDQLDLIALNLFEYLGVPDHGFSDYINKVFKINEEMPNSTGALIEMCDQYLESYKTLDQQENFVKLDRLGICLIKDRDREIRYTGVFGSYRMTHSNFKKKSKPFSISNT